MQLLLTPRQSMISIQIGHLLARAIIDMINHFYNRSDHQTVLLLFLPNVYDVSIVVYLHFPVS